MEAVKQTNSPVVETLPSYLATNIRFLRRQRQMSQEELAQRVGLNRGNIASYENGTAEPKICNLLKISELFGVTILDITQKNLSDPLEMSAASQNFARLNHGEQQLIEQFVERTREIEAFLHSMQTCYEFKTKSLQNVTRDAQCVMTYFDQLHEVSNTLLRQHKALVDFVRCKCK